MSDEEKRPDEQTTPLGYWEQQAAQSPSGGPEPTAQFNPQSGYPAGQQPPAYPPPPYGGQPYSQPYAGQPYPAPGYAYGYQRPDHPKATTALVLGLVAVLGAVAFAGLTLVISPWAWAVGARVRREIRESGGYYGGESNATAGMVLGIIGTVLLVIAVIAVIALIVFLVTVAADGGWTLETA